VSKIINMNAYKLDLPGTMRNHNVFHESLLDLYTPPVGGQPSSEPHPMIVEETEEWEVDRRLGSRRRYRKLHYLVQWAGYNHIRTSWEPAEHLKNALDLVDDFHRERPDRPREKGYRVGGGGTEDTEAFWTFYCTLFLHFLLFSLDWISARYNGVGTGLTTYQWRWSFPVHRIRRKVAIERTDRLWDLWVRTIAYVG